MINEVLKAIESRRSHRAYSPEALEEEALSAVLQAGLQAPSATNRQPWHFSVVRDAALIQEIHDEAEKTIMAGNPAARSPRFQNPAFQMFYHAPAVIFLFGEKAFGWTQVDCGIAVENMALAAESLGIGSVILGMPRAAFSGPSGDRLRQRLQCPEGYDFVIALALGKAEDEKAAHDLHPEKIVYI